MISIFFNINAVFTLSELVTDLINDVLPFDQPKTLKQVGYSLGVLSLPLPPVLQVPVNGVLVVLFWNKVPSSLNFVEIFILKIKLVDVEYLVNQK